GGGGPAVRLEEGETGDARGGGEGQGGAGAAAVGRGEPVGQPLEGRPEGAEETRRDPFARERVTDPQAERERGLVGSGREPLQRSEGTARRPRQRDDRDSQAETAGAGEAQGAPAQRARQPSLGPGGEAAGGGAGGPLRVCGLEAEDAERLAPRDERRARDSGRPRGVLPEPGPGWHGLPRRVVAERA